MILKADNEGPDQTAPSAQSDQSLRCPSVQSDQVIRCPYTIKDTFSLSSVIIKRHKVREKAGRRT